MSTATEPTAAPDYAVEAAADLLEPLRVYYNGTEDRPTFGELAEEVAEWLHAWMSDANQASEPLWRD